MANFKDMVNEEEDVPVVNKKINTITKNQNTNEEKKSTRITKKKVEIDSFVESMLKSKTTKKNERLGLTINTEIYDKLKTLSVASGNSVTKIVSELLEKALINVETNEEYVEKFNENFIKKRKNN